jgi:hypothetical protein
MSEAELVPVTISVGGRDCVVMVSLADAAKLAEGRRKFAVLVREAKQKRELASDLYRRKPTPRRRATLIRAINNCTSYCNSHERTERLIEAAFAEPPEVWWPAFLDTWPMCDAGSREWKLFLLHKFRTCRDVGKHAFDFMPDDEREFYNSLPDLIEVWRGADMSTVRNFSWTLDPVKAEFFAVQRRGPRFPDPVIGHAFIKKSDVLVTIAGRGEKEIILDPRRLRKFTATRLPTAPTS